MRASGRARAKRRIAGCAILVALAFLAYWIRSSSEVPADVAAEPPSPNVSTTDVETVAETDPLASPPAERPAEPPLEHPAIRRFADLNRYSDDSRRIDEESYDLIEPNARYEDWQPLTGGDPDVPVFSALFTADRFALRDRETARIRVALRKDGVDVPFRRLTLHARPVGPKLEEGQREPVRLAVDRDGNARTAELDANELWPEHVGRVEAVVRFTADGLAEQTATLAFRVTPARHVPARFDGQFADRLRDGDVVVEAGVEVETPGVYRIEGNLYDGHGDPVAWARFQGALAAGEQSAPIVFDGLILRDAGARGPFSLRQLRGYRMRPGDVPHREDLPDWPTAHVLEGHYVSSELRDEPRVSPRDERMRARLRDALARGVRLGEPSPLASREIR